MSSPQITYTARHDATPETELSALTDAYQFLLDSAGKKAAPASRPEDARKDKDAGTHTHCT
jgi:hypothetical protein